MPRRPGNRIVAVDRPRQKGWWGKPEPEELDAVAADPEASPREPVRRSGALRQQRTAAVGRPLTPNQIEAIRAVMHLFVDDDLGRGLDPRAALYCDRCETARVAAGSVRYGRLTFCNACSTDFEIARARGLLDDAADFLDRGTPNARSA